ncbi:hypothetical protein POM88_039744 [Heracleum sosnowskyi]|uniref:Transposase-associated domain-containing protein n=1 Tax=Heracleum sosnowskyi TaxID=360622 RepID=A0AAD8HDE0_9APIA|nr:hypothetical protein POM88_039744 [Heracleum sosnowskyi]
MASDRSWMNRRFDANKKITDDYKIGVEDFIRYAVARTEDSKGRIRCPCTECGNYYIKYPDDVILDLYRHGIMPGYTTWSSHGESDRSRDDTGTSSRNVGNIHDDFYDAREMLEDFAEANRHFQNVEEEPTTVASHFYKMLDNATEPLYPNCERLVKYYVLINSPEVAPYLSEFQKLVHRHHPEFNDAQKEEKQKELFANWFERRVKDDIELKAKFKDLIKGPSYEVQSYKVSNSSSSHVEKVVFHDGSNFFIDLRNFENDYSVHEDNEPQKDDEDISVDEQSGSENDDDDNDDLI